MQQYEMQEFLSFINKDGLKIFHVTMSYLK